MLYGGKEDDNLNKLRHVKYVQKLSSSTSSLQPNKLPPTSSAVKFHSLRTYFQVQEWLHLKEDQSFKLTPVDWGWESKMSRNQDDSVCLSGTESRMPYAAAGTASPILRGARRGYGRIHCAIACPTSG